MKIATTKDYYKPTIIDHLIVNVCNITQVLSLAFLFYLLIIAGLMTYKHIAQEKRKPIIIENFEHSQAEKLANELRKIDGLTVIIK